MTKMRLLTLTLLAVFALGSGIAHAEGDAEKGKKVFNKCKACHSLEAGKNKIGPSLHGLIGRPSGSIEGFNYSDAMKNAGLTWDEATLDKYLTDPRGFVPGGKKSLPRIADAAKRQALIAYLKSLGRRNP